MLRFWAWIAVLLSVRDTGRDASVVGTAIVVVLLLLLLTVVTIMGLATMALL